MQIHQGHRDRLRARFLEDGLDGFDDHQVLELLLFHVITRGDTNPTAHRLVQRFGSLSAVLEADPKDLASIDGVGPRAAAFLSLIPQLTRRYFHDRVRRENPRLASSEAVADYVSPLMAGRPEEVFYVLCLDSHFRVLYPALIGEGTVKEAHVEPRHVVEEALRHRAASVVLAHNHPGGAAKPSTADHRLTALLVQALGSIGIPVLDHVIVAGEQTYSFAREGALPKYNPQERRRWITQRHNSGPSTPWTGTCKSSPAQARARPRSSPSGSSPCCATRRLKGLGHPTSSPSPSPRRPQES